MVLPREGLSAARLLPLIGVFGFFGVFGYLNGFFDDDGLITIFIVIAIIVLVVPLVIGAFQRSEITIDHNALTVSGGVFSKGLGTIMKNDLEELTVSGNKLTALSDEKFLTFKVYSSNPQDPQFVHDTIVYHLGR